MHAFLVLINNNTSMSTESKTTLGFGSLLLLLLATGVTSKRDTINTTQVLRDGDSIVSAGGSFELGFFSPGSGSSKRYLGIWYHSIPEKTVVWVANRGIPLNGSSSGSLRITNQGVLTLLGRNGTVAWSSSFNASGSGDSSSMAQLLESGNLVVSHEGRTIWQSFDYPSDTLLPGMKFGWDLETRHEWFLSNWMTEDDPSQGNFTYRFDLGGYPQVVIKENSTIMYRSGPYDGLSFSGYPPLRPSPFYIFNILIDQNEVYYSFDLKDNSFLSRLVLQPSGKVYLLRWIANTGWEIYLSVQADECDRYAVCGAYGSCNNNTTPICSCLDGYVPKIPDKWNMYDWTSGCVRKRELKCSSDGFRKYSGIKLPETSKSWYNESLSLVECKEVCARNCSCTAYTALDITVGNGCLLWLHELIDVRESINGQDIYIRMPASELESHRPSLNRKEQLGIAFGCIISVGILFLAIYIYRKKLKNCSNIKREKEDVELPLFDLETVSQATNNFSENNKIGQGGFGTVYLGILKDGQQIAVKRLSTNSTQGLDEFMNEVVHIAKLQHRNLVRLLGCCVDEDEKMLIYEFMPNKSLDNFIFGKEESKQLLDWPNRCSIINGIARGLLYLHQDSRLRIIHRDLKVSNVLLDPEMNPKISDFGLARSFVGNESEANTKKVVGTYGYMSPEYAIDGLYSTKSDVFSFGVMVLEIISGKRNRGFSHPDHQLNLLGHAWTLFTEGRSFELATDSIAESCISSQVHRVIQIGLLCVQRNPKDRPSMSDVVLMLGSEGGLPKPRQPGFFSERNLVDLDLSSTSRQNKGLSSNEMTITIFEAR